MNYVLFYERTKSLQNMHDVLGVVLSQCLLSCNFIGHSVLHFLKVASQKHNK